MLRWYPSVLLQVVLELTLVPIVFFSIFAVNVIVDRDTPWAIGGASGTGMSRGMWLLPPILALGWTVLTLGWRGANAMFKCLLVCWHLGLATASIILMFQPGDLEFRGETVGFAISLELLGPVFLVGTLVCALVWVARDMRLGTKNRSVSPLRLRNKLAGCVSIVALAFSSWAYSSDFDQLGTLAGIVAAVALHEVIRPLNPSKEIHRAFTMEGSAPR